MSRVNYGQDGTIRAFVNLVSLAGAGLGWWRSLLHSGWQLPGLRAPAGPRSGRGYVHRRRSKLSKLSTIPRRVAASMRSTTEQQREQGFDAVILAAPLELTAIQLNNIARVVAGVCQAPLPGHARDVCRRAAEPRLFWPAARRTAARDDLDDREPPRCRSPRSAWSVTRPRLSCRSTRSFRASRSKTRCSDRSLRGQPRRRV